MKKNIFFSGLKLFLVLIVFNTIVKAQTEGEYINGPVTFFANSPHAKLGDVTFGPQARVHIQDGAKIIFYGKVMKVLFGAQFISLNSLGNVASVGTGKIVFQSGNPVDPSVKTQTLLAGGVPMLNIEINNENGVFLASGSNARISQRLIFEKGKLFLGDANLILDEKTTIEGADQTKHIVTDGMGYVSKAAIAASSSFTFPIGMGLGYNPVKVTNREGISRTIYAQVKDFAKSTADETTLTNKSIDRTWQIFSDDPGVVDLELQHDVSTNQSGFDNTKGIVSQQTASGVWSQSCDAVDGGSPVSVTLGKNFVLPNLIDHTAYFTKQTSVCAGVDLEIVKTVSLPNVATLNDENFFYYLKVVNKGLAKATSVVALDELPKGLKYQTHSASLGTTASYDAGSNTLKWDIGTLSKTDTATLKLTVRYPGEELSKGEEKRILNTATVKGAEVEDELANNTSSVEKSVLLYESTANVLTPDGDGRNDKLEFIELVGVDGAILEIFNRLGNVIYRSENYKNDWKGLGLQAGTYFYYLRYRDANGLVRNKRSWITVIRKD